MLQTEATLSTSDTYAYYEIIDLGNFGGIESVPMGINESGQVIVTVIPPRGSGTHIRSVIWENGTVTDLGTLGGVGDTMADGLNDLGQVVGHSGTSNGSTHGFLWENGAMTDLGAISNDFSRAYGINNNSQITGWTQIDNSPDPRGVTRAFIWENGTMTNLGTLGGWVSYGFSINDFGRVAGYSYNSSGQVHGFFWENNVMTDIGSIVGTFVNINNSGQIVGCSTNGHGFLWDDGIMTDIGTLGGNSSKAKSINNVGQVVGSSKILTGEKHAFIWENGTMVDLNTLIDPSSEWILNSAYSINDKGWIVGVGIHPDGAMHAFLLKPPLPATEVSVDIKPQSCPNPLNVRSEGILPVAILGSEDVNVIDIDPNSIELAGVGVIHNAYEDIATPVLDPNDCNCTTNGPDGFLDLTLKFNAQDIVEAMCEANVGDILPLLLTGELFDGTPIEGKGCVIMKGKYSKKADINKDCVVDFLDYAFFADYFGLTDCNDINDCNSADLDYSGAVDMNDVNIFTSYWMFGK
ncbi:MAG: hypothetical protein ACYTE8_02000 [Planctomycetota bacterium]